MRFELQRAAMPSQPSEHIETFANPAPEHDYTIHMHMPEFTCLCPRTGQPDFATLELEYVPDRLCVELKSLKLYVWSFRNRPAFHEAVANEIIDHLARAVAPLVIYPDQTMLERLEWVPLDEAEGADK